jgi:hypothetical protein
VSTTKEALENLLREEQRLRLTLSALDFVAGVANSFNNSLLVREFSHHPGSERFWDGMRDIRIQLLSALDAVRVQALATEAMASPEKMKLHERIAHEAFGQVPGTLKKSIMHYLRPQFISGSYYASEEKDLQKDLDEKRSAMKKGRRR